MKKSSVSRTRRFTYFQILCYALERGARTHNQILFGKTSWRGSRVHHNTGFWTQLMVSQWNSSGIFSQDSRHCSSATKSKSSCQKWGESQKNLQDGCEHSYMEYIYVCHSSSCSSSWTRLFIELTIRQESFFEACAAFLSDSSEVDQRIRRRSQDCPRSTGTSLYENHLCCVMVLFELWNPKPTSLLRDISPDPLQAWKDKI